MKNRRKLPSRLCALLLAMALLCSIGIPQAAAAGGSVSWSQVDNDAVTAQLPLQEAEEAAPAYRDTDLVRVSIFLEDAPAISKFGGGPVPGQPGDPSGGHGPGHLRPSPGRKAAGCGLEPDLGR